MEQTAPQKETDSGTTVAERGFIMITEFDEDCEELSPAMMKAFKCAVVRKNRRENT